VEPLKKFLNLVNPEVVDSKFAEKIYVFCLKEAVYRAGLLCLFFSFMFGFYGIMSTQYLVQFEPDITYFSNTWPRILFNTIPLLLVGLYLRKGKLSDSKKMYLWCGVFPLMLHVASWVQVWPTALHGHPKVLAYCDAANVYLITLLYTVAAPPLRHIAALTTCLLIFFAVPLFFVAQQTNDVTVLKLMLNDTLSGMTAGVIVCVLVLRLRQRIARLELEHEDEAKKFLGETVTKAIFQDRKDLLESRVATGYLLCTDVRGYTGLVRNSPRELVVQFMEEYFKLLSETVGNFGGYLHKTVGDGHIISFGLMDYEPNLVDIPDLIDEDRRARIQRQHALVQNATRCFEKTVMGAQYLARMHQLPEIRISGALDYGDVEIKVVGDSLYRKELDLYGDTVIRCARLQAHTKAIESKFNPTASLLVVSPSASPFIPESLAMVSMATKEHPVRDFPEIKKILVMPIEPLPQGTSRRVALG
jgi:class 3 adenylate cyclase